jgi:thiamine transporter
MDGLLAWGLTSGMLTACILLDYVLPFLVLGLAGLFRKKGIPGYLLGIVLVLSLRFVSHILSGVFIFHSAGVLWEGFSTENEWLYSFIYNATYMLPEIALTCGGAAILLRNRYFLKLVEVEKE